MRDRRCAFNGAALHLVEIKAKHDPNAEVSISYEVMARDGGAPQPTHKLELVIVMVDL